MSPTTLPTDPETGPSTASVDDDSRFAQMPDLLVEDEHGDDTQSSRARAAEVGTSKQQFDRAELLRRRYAKGLSSARRPKFTLKHEWIGRVEDVHEDTFDATLVTRSAPGEIEQAEIEIEEVAPKDLLRLRRGAVFYWVVGYKDEPHGQRLGVSSIIFREMVEPTEEQLRDAQEEAEATLAFLGASAAVTAPDG